MKLKTRDGEVFFNAQWISHIHLSGDRSLLTVHFVNGSTFGATAETEVETAAIADFLEELAAQKSGFATLGNEVLNLKSAFWIVIPDEGPVQIRSADNRTRCLEDYDRDRLKTLLAE